MKRHITLQNIPSIVAHDIIPRFQKFRIFTFYGTLGTGKTTFIKEILAQCGITEVVTSPTFAYVNTYITPEKKAFHHFDLYRLQTVEDFIGAGFNEYLYQENALCLIEWPLCIKSILEAQTIDPITCSITLAYDLQDQEKRLFAIAP